MTCGARDMLRETTLLEEFSGFANEKIAEMLAKPEEQAEIYTDINAL